MKAATTNQMTAIDTLQLIRNAFWNASQQVKGQKNRDLLIALGYAICNAEDQAKLDLEPFEWQKKVIAAIIDHTQHA